MSVIHGRVLFVSSKILVIFGMTNINRKERTQIPTKVMNSGYIMAERISLIIFALPSRYSESRSNTLSREPLASPAATIPL